MLFMFSVYFSSWGKAIVYCPKKIFFLIVHVLSATIGFYLASDILLFVFPFFVTVTVVNI